MFDYGENSWLITAKKSPGALNSAFLPPLKENDQALPNISPRERLQDQEEGFTNS